MRPGPALRVRSALLAAALIAIVPAPSAQAQSERQENPVSTVSGAEEDDFHAAGEAFPVQIATPVGSVSLASTGDALGPRRYARRSEREGQGASQVRFAVAPIDRQKVAIAPIGVAGGYPTGLPVRNARISSRYGTRFHPVLRQYRFHGGIDIAAPMGSPIAATSDGTVTYSAYRGTYGLLVSIDHGNGVETRYAHMSATAVRAGQSVRRGEVIGYVGSTGRSTGPHVHYEIRHHDRTVDPLGR